MTSRPLYEPHEGHTRCGSFAALHCGQRLVRAALTRQAAFRFRVRDLDIFFLGTAMARPFHH
jgi:hypothetical protein